MKRNGMFSINYQRMNDYPDLERVWRDLESRSQKSVFLSWSWIKHMSSCDESNINVLSVNYQSKVIGLCLFKIKDTKIANIIKVKQCYLNRHGVDKLDQIWIEYNDFLVDLSMEKAVKTAMLEYFFSNQLADEVILGMSDLKTSNDIISNNILGTNSRVIIQSSGFIADLRSSSSLEEYLSTLSKNTRSQIKRSHRLLKQLGTIELIEAESVNEKLEFFNQAGKIHSERWENTEFGTGFSNPSFVNFHYNLISEVAQHNVTKIFKLSLNNHALAYIYLLIEDEKWLFYLSAIKFHSDNRIKIGLLFHSLIIEKAIESRIHFYDFLAGTARYKQSLSNIERYEQQLICYYKNTLTLRVVNQCRLFKLKLKAVFSTFNKNHPQIQVEQ